MLQKRMDIGIIKYVVETVGRKVYESDCFGEY